MTERTPDEAAARELYEETGAEEYTLHPLYVYSVSRAEQAESFGMLYFAIVEKLGPLPGYEMEELRSFSEFPQAETYPEIYPALLARVNEYISKL